MERVNDMRRIQFAKKILTLTCVLLLLAGCSAPPALEAQASAPAQQEDGVQVGAGVSIFAGSLMPGFAGGENSDASFLKPYGLCAMPGGGLLIVDCYANLLRTSTGGVVSNLAGNTQVLDKDGYPLGSYLNEAGEKAFLNRPRFAVVSSEGIVVFSDTGNHRIRVVQNGVVRLLAGSGTRGFRDGAYQDAWFDTPSGIAIGSEGTIYVADTLNHCIRAISPQGEVSTLAGGPQTAGMKDGPLSEALFCEPNDIQLGPDGALYVVDKGNQRIRRIANQTVTTVAGSGDEMDSETGYVVGGYRDGAAAQAQFQYPTGLFVAEDGTIYVADTGNNCIRAVTKDGTVTTIAGTRMAGSMGGSLKTARFNQPLDVYLEDGMLYVSDSYNHVIRAIELEAEKGGDGA